MTFYKAVVLAVLLCSVVRVYCQEVPFITFNGDTLPNHSYLEFSQIGRSDSSNNVSCHTDLTTCCSSVQGTDRGDWYFPNGNRLQFLPTGIYESRRSTAVFLGNGRDYDPQDLMEGIYKCTIETVAVRSDDTETRETVYIGLYISGGEVSFPDGMSFSLDSELTAEVPQFTLTCISTGGPATNVTWTRDSQEITGGTTVLDDRVTAQYTHTLTVTGRLGGLYQCTVSNGKPSRGVSTLLINVGSVAAPSSIVGTFISETEVSVNWLPPDRLDHVTGYRIHYTGSGSSQRIDVDGGSTSSYTLTGLRSDVSYVLTMATLSYYSSSEVVSAAYPVTIGEVSIPDGMSFSLDSELTAEVPQFTLTCISTGGLATTVTWTRDSQEIAGGTTVLDDSETLQYTHTLTVTGRLGGLYHCTVSNGKPSQAMGGLTVRSAVNPTRLEVSQSSTNALKLSWTPPNPLEDVTGYRVYYDSDGGSSGSIDIAGGSYTSQILSGLNSGVSYTVSLTALSAHLPSPVVRYLDMIPIMTKPVVSVRTTRATSVVIVWRASFGAERYEVSYERAKGQQQNGHCRSQSHSGVLEVSAPTARVDITGLEEYSSYFVTVTARRGHQSLVTSEQVTFMTRSAGASAPPQNVVVTVESSTSIKLSWSPIGDCSAINGDITGWKVQYSGPGSSSRFVMVAGSNHASGQLTLTGLLFSTEYWFQVAAANSNSQTGVYSRRLTTTTIGNAPPTLSAVSHNTTAIEVTWSQTQLAGWDSSDIVYQFSYSTRERKLVTRLVRELPADTTSIVVDVRDASPELQHVFTIRNNLKVQGKLYQGIPGNTSFIFDKAFIQLQFGSVEHCLTWTQEQAREIEEQLQFEITEAILQGCSECEQYTAGFLLRRGVFLCQSQPTMATYRSSLVSPGLANASSLVQHVQHWVDTAPVVRLDWLLVRINQACPVALHQLSDPECSMPESLAHDPQVINAFNRCAIRSLGSQMCT